MAISVSTNLSAHASQSRCPTLCVLSLSLSLNSPRTNPNTFKLGLDVLLLEFIAHTEGPWQPTKTITTTIHGKGTFVPRVYLS